MITYGFRYRFLLSRGSMISYEAPKLEIPIQGELLTLKMMDSSKLSINKSKDLVVIGQGYQSIEEALHAGRKVGKALLLCCINFNMGIDVSDKEVVVQEKEFVFDRPDGSKERVIDDAYGLCVFPEDIKVIVLSFGVPAVTTGPGEPLFSSKFRDIITNLPEINPRLKLAIEMYSAAYFELTSRARFITWITSIECLSEKKKLMTPIVVLLDEFIRSAKNRLGLEDSDYIVKRLSEIKIDSISRACQNLVRDTLGEEEVEPFKSYYSIRCEMVHTGNVPDGIDLGLETANLERFVSRLLLATLKL